jgi:hypothetical protein
VGSRPISDSLVKKMLNPTKSIRPKLKVGCSSEGINKIIKQSSTESNFFIIAVLLKETVRMHARKMPKRMTMLSLE